MPQIKRFCCSGVLLAIVILAAGVESHCAEVSAIVRATTEPNLRAGPGLNHPSIKVLKDGERVVIQKQEGEWYAVIAAGGLKGYLHTTVLTFPKMKPELTVADDKSQSRQGNNVTTIDSSSSTPSAPQPVAAAPTEPEPLAPATPPIAQSNSDVQTDSVPALPAPSLMKLLEGRERDMVLWLAIAVAFFLIGWICGGNYYLRRDRIRRTKLRF